MIAAGIDAGTQSIKVLVYDSDKHEIIALTSSPLPLIEEEGGIREQKASWWIEALRKCFSCIPREIRERIETIAVSGQQHGFVPFSKRKGVLHNVKLWCDTSTATECMELEEKAGGREALAKKLGNPILPGYTASKILWLYKWQRNSGTRSFQAIRQARSSGSIRGTGESMMRWTVYSFLMTI